MKTYMEKYGYFSLDYHCHPFLYGALYCLCYSLAGYPPFSDERKDMDLPKQILGGHYSFPKQYWKGISETGELFSGFVTVFIWL